MKFNVLAVLVLLSAFSCLDKPDANKIIDQSISASGGDLLLKSTVEFDFRGRHYKSIRDGGAYQYERIFSDSLDAIRDVLNNDGFERFTNNEATAVADTMAVKYTASVNSVLYFALLPYGLNDAAVNKTYLGESTVKGAAYHKIKVTFDQEGGGEDYQDVFIYWVHQQSSTIDYLAYSYEESDGVGSRFREAYNVRNVNGIRFVDYINYAYEGDQFAMADYDKAFEQDGLKKLSVIALEEVKVSLP
jgi:hypothetical protein